MTINNMGLSNVQILIPAEEFSNTIKNIFEEVLKAHNICVVHPTSSDNIDSDYLLTRKQVCQLLGISLPTLASHIRKGKIPYSKIGKKFLFDKKTLLDTINKKGGIKC